MKKKRTDVRITAADEEETSHAWPLCLPWIFCCVRWLSGPLRRTGKPGCCPSSSLLLPILSLLPSWFLPIYLYFLLSLRLCLPPFLLLQLLLWSDWIFSFSSLSKPVFLQWHQCLLLLSPSVAQNQRVVLKQAQWTWAIRDYSWSCSGSLNSVSCFNLKRRKIEVLSVFLSSISALLNAKEAVETLQLSVYFT